MKVRRQSPPADRRHERGISMIIVLGALVSLIAISSLAIDVGILWAARTQLQNAADAAALAGGLNLIDPSGPSVTRTAAETAAIDVCSKNGAVGSSSLALPVSDVKLGFWDPDARTFDPNVDLNNPDAVTGVDVNTRLDNVANGPVPAFFSRVLGRNSFRVGANATAYLGYAGSLGPGQIELPIVIDCCKLKGSECKQDYCQTIDTNPPNPCDLASPQDDGVTSVSCLEFHPTQDQNACWTQYEESASSVNSNELRDIIQYGFDDDISNTMRIFLDNGDKASVVNELSDKFYGNGKYNGDPAGIDRYEPKDGVSDSWVTGIPIVECQEDQNCAGGTNAKVVGFACIEIREIEVSPLNIIRTRFLCPDDPLFTGCDLGRTGTGGLDFGIRADIPVLVR